VMIEKENTSWTLHKNIWRFIMMLFYSQEI
jgi:hypothetical protein